MKEKIIEILHNLVLADNLATTWKIKCHKSATGIEQLINQEVDRRIAERMPSDEDIRLEFPIGGTFKMRYNSDYAESIKENQSKRLGAFWLRSRLINDSQKTEGGGE